MADIIFWKPNDFRGTLYSRAFGVADYYEMAGMKFWKLYDFRTTLYTGVFGVADYEFQIGFSEFHIADPIWQT